MKDGLSNFFLLPPWGVGWGHDALLLLFLPVLLLLLGLLGGLGGGAAHILGGDGLDDTDGHGLPHVTDGEAAKRGEVREGLHAHGLGGVQLNDAGVSRLDELGVALSRLAYGEERI